MRSGHRYQKKPSYRTPAVDELEELRRNTQYNARKLGGTSTPVKRRISLAPIESLTEFNVAEYLKGLSSELTVGQAAHLSPKYCAEVQQAVRRSYKPEAEANLIDSDEEEATTAAKIFLRVNHKPQTAIIDSGATTSIITKSLLDRLGFKIAKDSRLVVVTANGARTKSLGVTSKLPDRKSTRLN